LGSHGLQSAESPQSIAGHAPLIVSQVKPLPHVISPQASCAAAWLAIKSCAPRANPMSAARFQETARDEF
jgi:hypothetical protein